MSDTANNSSSAEKDDDSGVTQDLQQAGAAAASGNSLQPLALFQGNPQFFLNHNGQGQSGRHSAPTVPSVPLCPGVPQVPPINFAAASLEPTPKVLKKKKKKKGAKKKEQTAKVPKPTKQGGKGMGFTNEEHEIPMNLMEADLPIGKDAWELAVTQCNKNVNSERWRDAPSLQRKWRALHSKKMGTGDPNVPPEVRRASKEDSVQNSRQGTAHSCG